MPRLAIVSTLPVALLLLLHTASATYDNAYAYTYPWQARPSTLTTTASTAITPYHPHAPYPPARNCSTKTLYGTSSYYQPPPATYDTSKYLFPTRLPPSLSHAPPATYDTSKYLFPTRLPPSSSPTPATYDTSKYLFPTRLPPGYLSTHTSASPSGYPVESGSTTNATFHSPTPGPETTTSQVASLSTASSVQGLVTSQTQGATTTPQTASPTPSAGEPLFTGAAARVADGWSWRVNVGAGVLLGLLSWL